MVQACHHPKAAQAWQKGKVGCYEFQASLGYKKTPYRKTTGNRSQQSYKASSNLPQSIWEAFFPACLLSQKPGATEKTFCEFEFFH